MTSKEGSLVNHRCEESPTLTNAIWSMTQMTDLGSGIWIKVGNELQEATIYEDRAQQSPVTRWSRHKTVAHVTLRDTLASTANILQTVGDLHPVCLGLRCQGLAGPPVTPRKTVSERRSLATYTVSKARKACQDVGAPRTSLRLMFWRAPWVPFVTFLNLSVRNRLKDILLGCNFLAK